MRTELEKLNGQKCVFTGKLKLIRERKGHCNTPVKSMLLVGLRTKDGKPLTDHTWVTYNKKFQQLDLKEGSIVKFEATVKSYEIERNSVVETDYCLTYTTRVKLLKGR
jgi:hypothetical protein